MSNLPTSAAAGVDGPVVVVEKDVNNDVDGVTSDNGVKPVDGVTSDDGVTPDDSVSRTLSMRSSRSTRSEEIRLAIELEAMKRRNACEERKRNLQLQIEEEEETLASSRRRRVLIKEQEQLQRQQQEDELETKHRLAVIDRYAQWNFLSRHPVFNTKGATTRHNSHGI